MGNYRRIMRRFCIWLFAVLAVILGILYYKNYATDLENCYQENLYETQDGHSELKPLPHILLLKERPPKNQGIFFHETSCKRRRSGWTYFHGKSGKNIAELSVPHACAVEAAAMHNPHRKVYVLYANLAYWSNATLTPQMRALQKYENVQLVNAPIFSYAVDTPGERLLSGNVDGYDLWASKDLPKQLQRFLLCITLWRWGGLIMDFDTITLRNVEALPANYVWLQTVRNHLKVVPNIIQLSLDVNGTENARILFDFFVTMFLSNELPHYRGSLLYLWLQVLCHGVLTEHSNYSLYHQCHGVTMLPTRLHALLHVRQLTRFSRNDEIREALKHMTEEIYLVEVWNRAGQATNYRINPQSVYGVLAKKNCPQVFEMANEFY